MTVLYLHGFASGPSSTKAAFFRRKFRERGVEMEAPDLAGGDFEHLTITGQLRVIEQAAAGRPVMLVGSSMGGYLAALYAARYPEVERLVLLAPAFSFAKRWPEVMGTEAMTHWRETGWHPVYHYSARRELKLSYGLIEDALQFEDYPDVRQPTLILHGTGDEVVPSHLSEEFARLRASVRLVLLQSGHELTDVMERLWLETAQFSQLGSEGVAPRYPV